MDQILHHLIAGFCISQVVNRIWPIKMSNSSLVRLSSAQQPGDAAQSSSSSTSKLSPSFNQGALSCGWDTDPQNPSRQLIGEIYAKCIYASQCTNRYKILSIYSMIGKRSGWEKRWTFLIYGKTLGFCFGIFGANMGPTGSETWNPPLLNIGVPTPLTPLFLLVFLFGGGHHSTMSTMWKWGLLDPTHNLAPLFLWMIAIDQG